MGFSDLVLRWGELWRGLNLLPASTMLAPLGPNRAVMPPPLGAVPVAAGALWMALSWFPRVLFSSWVSMQS